MERLRVTWFPRTAPFIRSSGIGGAKRHGDNNMKDESSPFYSGSGATGQPHKKTLTSVKDNLSVETWEVNAEDITT